jgi:hypothetical protein
LTAALATAPHALHRDCDVNSVYLLIGRSYAAKHPFGVTCSSRF